MVKIEIPFKQTPTSIESIRGTVTTVVTEAPAEPAAPDQPDAAHTLGAMASQIQQLDQIMKAKVEMIGSQVRTIAMELAHQALSGDDDLVQLRVQQFAETLLAESSLEGHQQQSPVKLFAHPSCIVTLRQWCEQTERNDLSVFPDASLAPGDARVEVGSTGLLAALTELLNSAAKAYTPAGEPLQR